MKTYTFEDFVQRANWNASSQAGALMEFIRFLGLKDQLDQFLTENYSHELEDEDEGDEDDEE